MSNSENIRPYSEMVHTAAQNGGPDRFVQDIAEKNYERGIEDERATEWWKGAVLVVIALGLSEGIRWVVKKSPKRHKDRSAQLKAESDAAIAAYKECCANDELEQVNLSDSNSESDWNKNETQAMTDERTAEKT